jgi:hypothetical protein
LGEVLKGDRMAKAVYEINFKGKITRYVFEMFAVTEGQSV